MRRFIIRNRRAITVVTVIFMIALFAYLIYKTKQLGYGLYKNNTYPGSAFGTSVKTTIYDNDINKRDEASKLVIEDLRGLDERISYRVEGSEMALLNKNYEIDGLNKVSPDVASWINREIEISKETDGAFSPCILPLTQLWGIEDGNEEIPEASYIEDALPLVDSSGLEVVDSSVVIHEFGMGLDLGAVGKGVAADIVKEELDKCGVSGAVVSIGGTVLVYGDKGDNRPWHIGIRDPRGGIDDVLGVLDTEGNTVISTSGDYEQYFEKDGVRYHHIFDPRTGYPANNGLISVTIITPDGFLSDAMSTACFVMGLKDGLAYAEKKGVSAIFVTEDKKVYTTKDINKSFILKAKGYKLEK
ncbi:MAG: FAD:protein FMN transferase [Lachnospiraceae bacterium]|jgi:thiamine biosynthesis lipoprotein|nr:FAD:protein FMN transferase [Lachnospiraceae bacterium]